MHIMIIIIFIFAACNALSHSFDRSIHFMQHSLNEAWRERRKEQKNISKKRFYEEPSKVMSIIHTLFFSFSWSSYNKSKEEYKIIKKNMKSNLTQRYKLLKNSFFPRYFLKQLILCWFLSTLHFSLSLFLDHTTI